MDIEEGFSPIERAATMSIACANRAAFRAIKHSSGNGPLLNLAAITFQSALNTELTFSLGELANAL
jgi:hypothetical protein